MKSLLGIISQPPYRGSQVLENIEAAMVAAVFDFKVSLLFRDEGLWALIKQQDAENLGQRTISKVSSALPTYEITAIYVGLEDLKQRDLLLSDLCLPVTLLDRAGQGALISRQHAVFGGSV